MRCRRPYAPWTVTSARWWTSPTRAAPPPGEFEWLGIPRSLERGNTRGAQNTSVDGFLVAETITGCGRAYLLEWKYVEQYQSTRPDFKGEGKAGANRMVDAGWIFPSTPE